MLTKEGHFLGSHGMMLADGTILGPDGITKYDANKAKTEAFKELKNWNMIFAKRRLGQIDFNNVQMLLI